MKVWKLSALALAVLVAACASNSGSTSRSQPPASLATASSEGSLPGASVSPVEVASSHTFPVSSVAAAGKPWQNMHANGNVMGPEYNCKALGFTPSQCDRFQAMRNAGQCFESQVPNGVVLNALSFNDAKDGGKFKIQYNVLVDLQNPSTRAVLICELARGDFIVHFLGCNNYARVKGRPAAPRAAIQPQPMPTQVHANKACGPFQAGHFSFCFQIFQPVGAANRLVCDQTDSRDLYPDALRQNVPLYMRPVHMKFVLKGANVDGKPLGSKFAVPLSSGGTVVLELINNKGHLYGEFNFAGEATLYVPDSLAKRGIEMAAWSDDPLLKNGYPQSCDCEEDGYGDEKGGAMRVRDNKDHLGDKMFRFINGTPRQGEQKRLVFSFRAGNPAR